MLVNDIWGAEVLKGGPAGLGHARSGRTTSTTGLRILRLGIDTHLITSHHLLPLLIERPGGLLVEVTDGTTDYNADHYRISVFYDLVKIAVEPPRILARATNSHRTAAPQSPSRRGGCARR